MQTQTVIIHVYMYGCMLCVSIHANTCTVIMQTICKHAKDTYAYNNRVLMQPLFSDSCRIREDLCV